MFVKNAIVKFFSKKGSIENEDERAFERYHEELGTEQSLRRMKQVPGPEEISVMHPLECKVPNILLRKPKPLVLEFIRPPSPSGSLSSIRSYPDMYNPDDSANESPAFGQKRLVHVSQNPVEILCAGEVTSPERQCSRRKLNKVPPLTECEGIGRFRMAKNADPEYRMQRYMAEILAPAPDTIGYLGGRDMQQTEPGVFRVVSAESVTDDSSTRLKLSTSALVLTNHPQTGVHYYQGCHTATTSVSSIDASFCNGLCWSYTSALSPLRYVTNASVTANELRQTSKKFLSGLVPQARKPEYACNFNNVGDPNSAISSDGEEDGRGGWRDVQPSSLLQRTKRVSTLTRLFAKHEREAFAVQKCRLNTAQCSRSRPRLRARRSRTESRKTGVADNRCSSRNKAPKQSRTRTRALRQRGSIQSGCGERDEEQITKDNDPSHDPACQIVSLQHQSHKPPVQTSSPSYSPSPSGPPEPQQSSRATPLSSPSSLSLTSSTSTSDISDSQSTSGLWMRGTHTGPTRI